MHCPPTVRMASRRPTHKSVLGSWNPSTGTSALLLVVVLLCGATLPPATADDGWKNGRATWYGLNDGMNIGYGSCGYGSLPNDMVSTGVNIAALSDKNDDFAGSCGRCYEVQCAPMTFTDGYGEQLDRSGTCWSNSNASVIVTVTDACPCDYPANAYSNRRWCCGDMYHMVSCRKLLGQSHHWSSKTRSQSGLLV